MSEIIEKLSKAAFERAIESVGMSGREFVDLLWPALLAEASRREPMIAWGHVDCPEDGNTVWNLREVAEDRVRRMGGRIVKLVEEPTP